MKPTAPFGRASSRRFRTSKRQWTIWWWPEIASVGRFTYRGTHAGPFYGMPPTGNAIEMRSIDIWRTHNGEFVEHWDELNLLDLFQQIGMIPAFDLGDTESTT